MIFLFSAFFLKELDVNAKQKQKNIKRHQVQYQKCKFEVLQELQNLRIAKSYRKL